MLDGLNDADSRIRPKGVPSGFNWYRSPSRGQIAQDPNFGGVNRRFAVKRAKYILKRSYYRNYCIHHNQILHSDRDHQLNAGGPNMPQTNPRWRTAAILKKTKNRKISATDWPILIRFGRIWCITSYESCQPIKLQCDFLKHIFRWYVCFSSFGHRPLISCHFFVNLLICLSLSFTKTHRSMLITPGRKG